MVNTVPIALLVANKEPNLTNEQHRASHHFYQFFLEINANRVLRRPKFIQGTWGRDELSKVNFQANQCATIKSSSVASLTKQILQSVI